MSRPLVVDASVVVKWLLPEPGSDVARALLDQHDQFLAPEFVYAEAANMIWKRWRREELTTAEGQQLVDDLLALSVETIPTRVLVPEAWLFALVMKITVYDALYLALAQRLGSQVATADRRLAQAAERHAPELVRLLE